MIGRYDRGVTRRVRLVSDALAERQEVLEDKVYLRGVHPPDKICARCKSECGPSMVPGHATLCDACATTPSDKVDYQAVYASMKPVQEMVETPGFAYMDEAPGFDAAMRDERLKRLMSDLKPIPSTGNFNSPPAAADAVTHAIDCDMDEDCTCKPDEP